jgi:hypothetical protein
MVNNGLDCCERDLLVVTEKIVNIFVHTKAKDDSLMQGNSFVDFRSLFKELFFKDAKPTSQIAYY